ncbi:alpha/beta fold hydrolase [Streptomyces sp. NPDC057654]|uniref:alpha/beta fold hydrolase n=1 Tax=Streptomyces sp. NPDC057654 TaxID=3346196 RepID=UPI0036D051CC
MRFFPLPSESGRRRPAIPLVAVGVVAASLGAVSAAPSAASADGRIAQAARTGKASAAGEQLDWNPCVKVAKDWDKSDTKTECAMLTVPMDYAEPQGRKIKIAVSRLKAADPAKRRGSLFYSPGGPGLFNLYAPQSFAEGGLGTLATDHDVIGFDPRGVGYSEKKDCESAEYPGEPADATPKERAKIAYDYWAEEDKRCAALDPAFARQLTTANIARDVDRIRAALGEKKISFFGVSYGTAVGANYRSMFDDRVSRMWLESVMPPKMDFDAMNASLDALSENNFGEFAQWLSRHDVEYHFGTTADAVRHTLFDLRDQLTQKPRKVDEGTVLDGEWVTGRLGGGPGQWVESARDLATVREGGIPHSARPTAKSAWAARRPSARVFGFEDPHGGFNNLQYDAVMCNDGAGGRDFEKVWADKKAREQTYPATGGSLEFGKYCAGWPWPAQQWKPVKGKSPLQISGHTGEDTTPYDWAVDLKNAIGGTLLTIEDNQHASLSRVPECAAKAVDFFRTGHTSGGVCPGAQ